MVVLYDNIHLNHTFLRISHFAYFPNVAFILFTSFDDSFLIIRFMHTCFLNKNKNHLSNVQCMHDELDAVVNHKMQELHFTKISFWFRHREAHLSNRLFSQPCI